MTRDKGHEALRFALREFHGRNPLNRTLSWLVTGRPLLINSAVGVLGLAVRAGSALGAKRATSRALSAIFNLLYWQGVCDELGGRAVLHRSIAAATPVVPQTAPPLNRRCNTGGAPDGLMFERRVDLRVLDGLRGVAALYVVLFHATRFLWAFGGGFDPTVAGDVHPLANVWYGAMQYGQQAVLLFFVLSGFCIHYRQAREALVPEDRRQRFDLFDFARRRFRRLYPVLLVAIAATAALDFAGTLLNPGLYSGDPAMYDGALGRPVVKDLVDRSYAPGTLIGNLLLQSAIVVPAFGSNHALWSLAYEFWFYAAYPVFLVLSRLLGSWRTLTVAMLVSVLALSATRLTSLPLPPAAGAVASHWVTWVAGAVIAELYLRPMPGLIVRLFGLGGGAVLIALFVLRPGGTYTMASWQDLPYGLALGAVLAWAMLSPARSLIGRLLERSAPLLKPLGDISYSLYVLHLPWVLFVSALWLMLGGLLPRGGELMLLGVLTSLGLAAVCWYFVERHCVSSRQSAAATSSVRVATDRSARQPA
jgi:peptidoglycan/LPS O-acetylase OafA/YrhL